MLMFLPIFEILFFNLFFLDRCCHRRFSLSRTLIVLLGFSALFVLGFCLLSQKLAALGDGQLFIFGLLYIIPLNYLYKEKLPLLLIIMCTCLVYTLGIFSLAFQLAGLRFPRSPLALLIIENLLFLFTAYPFYQKLIPKYIFILENIDCFNQPWHRYIILNSILSFLLVGCSNLIYVDTDQTLLKFLVMLLLMAFLYSFYIILYHIVRNALTISQLKQEISRDSLTGLGSREQLHKDLTQQLDLQEPFTLLFIDLDHFKEINDNYGHVAGDQYMIYFAQNLSRFLGNIGKAYRFGGDEFIVICPGAVPDDVIRHLEECPEWDIQVAPCAFNHASVGALYCTKPFGNINQLLRKADEIMYQKKLKKTFPDSSRLQPL